MKNIIGKVITMLFILIAVFYCFISVKNDRIASEVKETLKDTPLPEDTLFREAVSAAGKLTGNGNGMQYFGAILISSKKTLEELETYYAKYRQNQWEYIVEPQTGVDIEAVEHGNLQFSYMRGLKQPEGYFIVYSWGSNENEILELFDLRGH